MSKPKEAPRIPFLSAINDWSGHGVLSVIGPTGSGKTSQVLKWVEQKFPKNLKEPLLVSVDAVAVWKGLDIGSAKPMGEERVPFDWIGLDFLNPDQDSNAMDFVDHVLPQIQEALQNARPVICVGGSHFYENTLMMGRAPGGPSDPQFLLQLEACSNDELFKRLTKVDARFATKVHVNDRYRLNRFLDLAERQKISFDALFTTTHGGLLDVVDPSNLFRSAVGMQIEIPELERRLAQRLKEMFSRGWVDEVKVLLKAGVSANSPALQSIGYREIVQFLQGELSEEEAFDLILIAHKQLAKKQRTWIRGLLKD